MSAALIALILGRNTLLNARVDAAIGMDQANTWLLEGVLEEKQHIVDLLTAMRDEAVGPATRPSRAQVAVVLENCVDLIRVHLDVFPPDFGAIERGISGGHSRRLRRCLEVLA